MFHKRRKELEEHEEERKVVRRAMDGDPKPLADYILSGGRLETPEGRNWVAARVRGDKKRRGAKRTLDQKKLEYGLLRQVLEIMIQENVKEHRAIEILCDRNPRLEFETLRGYARKNRKLIKAADVFSQIAAHRTDRHIS
jgi:hypothetical protein